MSGLELHCCCRRLGRLVLTRRALGSKTGVGRDEKSKGDEKHRRGGGEAVYDLCRGGEEVHDLVFVVFSLYFCAL